MKQVHLFVCLIVIWSQQVQSDNDYTCVWYKECGSVEVNGLDKVRNCLARIPGQPVNSSAAEVILKKRCPHFFVNTGKFYLFTYKSIDPFESFIFLLQKLVKIGGTS